MALKSTQFEPEKSEQIEDSLDELDKAVDRVKVMYEQYFLGIQKQPPSHLHTDCERKIRELAQLNIRNTGLRYRFNTLQQKFGSYNSYWRRTLRQIEQGKYFRNLSKVGRKAAQRGEDVPDEILAAMPKRMREQVLRDRDAAIALAKRQKLDAMAAAGATAEDGELTLADEDGDATAWISEPSVLRRGVAEHRKTGAIELDETDDFDIDGFLAAAAAVDEPAPETQKIDTVLPRIHIRNSGLIPTVKPEDLPKKTQVMPRAPTQAIPRAAATPPPPPPAATQAMPRAGTQAMPRAGTPPPPPPGSPNQFPRAPTPPPAPGASSPNQFPRAPTPPPAPGASSPNQFPRAPTPPPAPGASSPNQFPRAPTPPPPPRAGIPIAAVRTGVVPISSVAPGVLPIELLSAAPPPSTAPVRPTPMPAPRPTPAPARPAPVTGAHLVPPSAAAALRRPHAPSQQIKPLPIRPGASANQPAPAVQSVGGRAASPVQPPARPTPRPTAAPTRPTPAPPRDTVVTAAPAQKPPPGMTNNEVDALYTKYVAAKKMVGEDVKPDAARDKLLRTIHAQAPKIMEEYKAKGVDFSVVVKDNQVIIRAKPKP